VGVFAPAEPLPISAFEEAGCQMTIGAILGIYAAARGVSKALERLAQTRDWNALGDLIIDDKEFFKILNIDQYQPRYKEFNIA